MKIVINKCWGGFDLSLAGHEELHRRSGSDEPFDFADETEGLRTDPILVEMVEEDSSLYSGDSARLSVVEIPDGVEWYIHDYDGQEHVAEKHRTWA